MKCSKCGADLTEDTRFCSYCGAKVEVQTEIPPIPPDVEKADEPKTEEKYSYQNNTDNTASLASKTTSNADKIKTEFLGIWNKLSKFGKIATIGITVFLILGLVAFLRDRIFSGVLAVVQIAIVVVAILMKKQIVKVPKSWIPVAAIIVSFVL
ncbi:MAG: zinc ribbon domain-containing protein, partial [Eubacterium sp.]|nr:zinc ribbon domain-containing protein [Eubacterium sp.]